MLLNPMLSSLLQYQRIYFVLKLTMASHLTFIMSISSGIIYWPLLGSYLSRFFVDAGPLQVVVLLSLSFCRDTDSCITPRFGSFQTAVSLPDRWSFPDSCLTLVYFRDTNSLCPTLVCFRCTNHFQTVVSLPDLVIAKQMSRSQIWPFPNNCLTPRFWPYPDSCLSPVCFKRCKILT